MTLDERTRAENYHKRLADKGVITSKISDACRFVGFGLLAIFYTVETGDSGFAVAVSDTFPNAAFLIGLFGALAVLFDYLQFAAAHILVEQALKRTETYDYPRNGFLFARYAFYYAKQAAVGLGVGALIWIILQI